MKQKLTVEREQIQLQNEEMEKKVTVLDSAKLSPEGEISMKKELENEKKK